MDVYADQSTAVIKTIQQATDETRTQTMQEFQKWRSHIELWYWGIKSQVEKATGGGSIGQSGPSEGKGGKNIDRKEVSVWKLSEELDKQSFRHWLDAVDQQLAFVHDFKHARFIMNEIRRSAVEITNDSFENCIVAANTNIEISLTSMVITGDALNGVSTSASGSAFPDYKYLEKTMFLSSCLTCKLNTDLHSKTFGLDNQNGFEL